MRNLLVAACVVLIVSIMLIPVGTMHAHLDHSHHEQQNAVDLEQLYAIVHAAHTHGADLDDPLHEHDSAADPHEQPTMIHGGHTHTPEPGELGYVVDLPLAVVTESSSPAEFWAYWLPLAYFVAVLTLGLQLSIGLLRPPQNYPVPRANRTHWQPPPRGPPDITI